MLCIKALLTQIATDCGACHTFASLFCVNQGCNYPDTAFGKEVCVLLRISFRSPQTKGERRGRAETVSQHGSHNNPTHSSCFTSAEIMTLSTLLP